jgi:diaminopimelate epimerase
VPAASFLKYEGLGNDFILVETADAELVSPELAVRLCDRRFGVGADGVLLVLPGAEGRSAARMKVVNADGSIPEMCGNGLRCVAMHVAGRQGLEQGELAVDTDAGLRVCRVDAARGIVTVDLGPARVLGERTLELAQGHFVVTVVSVGNPHAVLFGDFSGDDVARLGPAMATHAIFPRGVNVGFAKHEGRALELVVWERGVGVTLACGTGACAAVAALCARGLARHDETVEVRLPGGTLTASIASQTEHVTLEGPARRVFSGEVDLAAPKPSAS